jgi:hypothetical protein
MRTMVWIQRDVMRPSNIVLTYAPRVPQNRRMHGRLHEPSPGVWTFAEHMYGIAHCLIDRMAA